MFTFRLIEILMAISAMMVLWVIPPFNFKAWQLQQQVIQAKNQWELTLHKARHQALKTGHNWILCPLSGSAQIAQCDPAATADWSQGWLLMPDPNVVQQTDVRYVIRHTSPMPLKLSYSLPNNRLIWSSNGFLAPGLLSENLDIQFMSNCPGCPPQRLIMNVWGNLIA